MNPHSYPDLTLRPQAVPLNYNFEKQRDDDLDSVKGRVPRRNRMAAICDGYVNVTATNTAEVQNAKEGLQQPSGIVCVTYRELLDPSDDLSARIEQASAVNVSFFCFVKHCNRCPDSLPGTARNVHYLVASPELSANHSIGSRTL